MGLCFGQLIPKCGEFTETLLCKLTIRKHIRNLFIIRPNCHKKTCATAVLCALPLYQINCRNALDAIQIRVIFCKLSSRTILVSESNIYPEYNDALCSAV